jgi:hypothetical protein
LPVAVPKGCSERPAALITEVVPSVSIDGKQFASSGPQGSAAVPGSIVSPGWKGVVRGAANAVLALNKENMSTSEAVFTKTLIDLPNIKFTSGGNVNITTEL